MWIWCHLLYQPQCTTSFLLPFLLPRDSIKPNILDHVMSPAHYIQAHFGETVMSIQVFQRKVKKKSPSFRLCSNHNQWEKWLRRFRRVSATSSGLVFDAASSKPTIRYLSRFGLRVSFVVIWFLQQIMDSGCENRHFFKIEEVPELIVDVTTLNFNGYDLIYHP